jgi:hypothetical protein
VFLQKSHSHHVNALRYRVSKQERSDRRVLNYSANAMAASYAKRVIQKKECEGKDEIV